MIIRRDDSGDLTLGRAPDFVLDALQQAADLCESDDPAIRASLIQSPFEDEEENEQWHRLVGDDLVHLFQSRSEIVRNDLGSAALESGARGPGGSDDAYGDLTWEVRIPVAHLSAWQETLNGASHALFAKFGLTAEDTQNAFHLADAPEKLLAVQQIRIYSMLLFVLLESEGYGDPESLGGPEDFEGPELDDDSGV